MFKSLAVLIFLIGLSEVCGQSPRYVYITIRDGQLKGAILESYGGREYHAFKNIPFGKPTAGVRRFKPPEPVDSWEGIWDATVSSLECPQIRPKSQQVIGTEDCLRLNVYIPQIKNKSSDELLPVLAYIHGGAFEVGTGSSGFKGPEKFMDYDSILVTLNYRLGILGFFSTGDKVSPGNYGMLDQVLGLKWIQKNIATFGGDPKKVTIFGESAGATSVIYHMLSPLSEGLFKNAIAQSGSPLNPWSFQKDPLRFPRKLAAHLNCKGTKSLHFFDCFKKTRVDHLIKASWELHETAYYPSYPAPAIEGPGGEGFLTEDPLVLMKEGRIHNKVSFYAGFVPDEGYLFSLGLDNKFQPRGRTFLDEKFGEYLSLAFDVHPENTQLISKIKDEYFSNQTTTAVIKSQLIKMLGDALYGACVNKVLQLFSDANVPTFAYKYTHMGEHSYAEFFGGVSGKYVSHVDETLLQFFYYYAKMNENDTKMSQILNTLWVTIASGREPKIITENGEVQWKPYSRKNPKYLQLNLDPKMKKGELCKKMDFWFDTVPSLTSAHQNKDEL